MGLGNYGVGFLLVARRGSLISIEFSEYFFLHIGKRPNDKRPHLCVEAFI